MLKTPPLGQVSTRERAQIAKWTGMEWNHWRLDRERAVRNYRLDHMRQKYPDKFLSIMKAIAVGEVSPRGNALYRSRYMSEFGGDYTYWLRYTDPSTGEVYVSGVPYGEKIRANGRQLRSWESETFDEHVDRGGNVIDTSRLMFLSSNAFAPQAIEWTVRRRKRQLWDCTTADGCMAWKLSMTLEEYLGIEAEA